MKSYFVYQHTRLDINEVFYIGIGTKVTEGRCARHECFYRRAYSVKGRNPYWHYIINKTDYKVDIIFESNIRQEVLDKEIELIETLKRKCDGGRLANISPGGESGSGGLSPLGKEKLRKAFGKSCYQYDLEGNYIQSFASVIEASEKTNTGKSGIHNALRSRGGMSNGYLWSKVFKGDKIKPYTSRFQHMPDRIYQYSLNGDFITSYNSIKEASKKLGIAYNRIYNTLFSDTKKGGNFQWFVHFQGDKIPPYKKVYQYDLYGRFIAEWDSTKDASTATGVPEGTISNALSGNRSKGKGFQWFRAYKGEITTPYVKTGTQKTFQYDLEGNFIKEFNSIAEASNYTGQKPSTIAYCIKGTRNKAYNFMWFPEFRGTKTNSYKRGIKLSHHAEE